MHSSTLQHATIKNGRIQITAATKSTITLRVVLSSLAIFTLLAPFLLDYNNIDWQTAIPMTLSNLQLMFLQPGLTQITFSTVILQVLITLALAFIATVLGAVVSFFLAVLSAKNITRSPISNIIIGFNAFIRAVPTVLWVLIFAIAAGLGAVACVLGMMLHTIAYLTKAYAESIEEMGDEPIEALRASGANWWHIVRHAVIPQCSSYIVSWTFLRFETNFDVAIAMGAAAAAGGIGFELFMASSF